MLFICAHVNEDGVLSVQEQEANSYSTALDGDKMELRIEHCSDASFLTRFV